MQAKAMVLDAPGQLRPRKFEVVSPPSGYLLIRTLVTSVCATDVKTFNGHTPLAKFPLIMGHEFAGEVVEIGDDAHTFSDLRVGDRITPEPYIPCGHCRWCRSTNYYHNCPDVDIFGISLSCDLYPHLLGGFAEYVYIPPNAIVHKLQPEVNALSSSLSSVIGNGVRWVHTLGKMHFGQSLVISGAGSQGLCSLAAAKEAGVGPIAMLGLSSDSVRFDLARKMGVDGIVQVDIEDPREEVPKIIGGAPDVVIETSGIPDAIKTAISLVRTSGRIVLIGLSGGRHTEVAFDDLVWRDITLVTGKGQAGNVYDALHLINSNRYPFEQINNFHYSLDDLEQAVKDSESPPEGFIKAAVIFD